MSLVFIYLFFLYRENQASLFSNKNFQIFQYVNNAETFNSKLRDMTYINSNIISQWRNRLIKYVKNIENNSTSSQKNQDDFNIESNSTEFVSNLIHVFNISNETSKFIFSFDINVNIILDHITRRFSLNQKQHMICEKILLHFLCYQNNQCESTSVSQLLLYIKEENEVKKNQIIKRIFYIMNLLN
jgi:hypothetical protein